MEIIKLLLQSPDVNKDTKDFYGNSPLYLAAELGASDDIITLLLDEGCDINITTNCKETPLHASVKRPSVFMAHELIKRGANINQIDDNGFTPLHEAVQANNLEAVCMLLYYNADVNLTCSCGLTPFLHAVNYSSRLEIARTLFPYCSDFSVKTKDGYTALLLAANSVNPIAIDIIKAGADVNYIPPENISVLFLSLFYKNSILFKETWCRLNLKIFLRISRIGKFLSHFMANCKFSTKDWLECLYIVLDSSIAKQLIDKCVIYIKQYKCLDFFHSVIRCFSARHVPLDDRIAIITLFLSYGIRPSMSSIDSVINIYGFNKELEVFINCACIKNVVKDKLYFPMSTFLFQQDYDNEDFIVALFIKQVESPKIFIKRKLRNESIVKALSYFSLSYHAKQKIITANFNDLDLKEAVKEKLEVIPEIPTLLELARNHVRRNIKKISKNIELGQYYKVANELPLPNILKDVINFKQPLYPWTSV